jgi:hypothetical protein
MSSSLLMEVGRYGRLLSLPERGVSDNLAILQRSPSRLSAALGAWEAQLRSTEKEAELSNTSLQTFIGKILVTRRLLYADLQRLQRVVLPDGCTSRADAEALIALEGVLDRVDEGWPGYLANTLSAFVLATSRPAGTIDRDAASWLVGALRVLPPRTATAIAREASLQATHVDGALLAYIGNDRKEKGKSRAAASARRSPDPIGPYRPDQPYRWGSVSVTFGEDCLPEPAV